MEPLIITVAGVGAELTRAEQPNLPLTANEIAEDAAACRDAGASIYHLHVRDGRGGPTMDVPTYRAALEAIKSSCDVIVQFSSGGSVHDDEDDRAAPLDLKPEMASLTTGTVNFGEDVFLNPRPLVTRLYRRMRELGILPEFEIFDSGMIAAADRLFQAHGDGHHRHYDFVLGVPGGMPAWPDAIDFLAGHLPSNATWSATGIGSANLSVTKVAVDRGGHVRTGMEDVRWFAKDVPVSSNVQLVKRVTDIAREVGRDIATPAQARHLLGL